MIMYKTGTWGMRFLCRLRGSVFPKSTVFALPNAFLAGVLSSTYKEELNALLSVAGVDTLWSGYTMVLGFLIVFRNNQAYSRFWEGATLIQQVRGEWFNSISSLIAFCTQEEDLRGQVDKFQNLLVRLMSMLYLSALQQVCDLEDDTLEIIDLDGIDPESLQFLEKVPDRCEVILQWIQRLIVDSENDGVLTVAPPILSRAYQELSRGVVNLNNARKIKEVPFPFPYAQMITVMLLVHWVITPVMACYYIQSTCWAAILSFLVTSGFWSLLYIAAEIDQPFGDDTNDLPLREMQRDMNQSLITLLHPLAQKPPTYEFDEEQWGNKGSKTDADASTNGYEAYKKPRFKRSDSYVSGLTGVSVVYDSDCGDLTETSAGFFPSRLPWLRRGKSKDSIGTEDGLTQDGLTENVIQTPAPMNSPSGNSCKESGIYTSECSNNGSEDKFRKPAGVADESAVDGDRSAAHGDSGADAGQRSVLRNAFKAVNAQGVARAFSILKSKKAPNDNSRLAQRGDGEQDELQPNAANIGSPSGMLAVAMEVPRPPMESDLADDLEQTVLQERMPVDPTSQEHAAALRTLQVWQRRMPVDSTSQREEAAVDGEMGEQLRCVAACSKSKPSTADPSKRVVVFQRQRSDPKLVAGNVCRTKL